MRRMGGGRGGRPGLLGTVARTAVIAGTASAVSGNVQRGQAQRAQTEQEAAAFRQQQAVPGAPAATPASAPVAAPAAPQGGLIEELTKLADLKNLGVLTDEEFAAAKARILQQ